MKLEKEVEPLPVDSTHDRPAAVGARPEVHRDHAGRVRGGLRAPATPSRWRRRSPSRSRSTRSSTPSTRRPARGSAAQPRRLRHGLAGRGDDLNEAIVDLRPLLIYLQPVRENLADPRHPAARASSRRSGARPREVAPVAETQAALFVNLDTTFAALASVARPFIQETISRSPAAEDAGDPRASRSSARSCATPRRSSASWGRACACCPPTRADPGRRARDRHHGRCAARRRSTAASRASSARSRTSPTDPLVPRGIQRLRDTVETLRPTLDVPRRRPRPSATT